MKKRILSLFLLSAVLFSACVSDEISGEQSGEMSQLASKGEESGYSSDDSKSVEASETTESETYDSSYEASEIESEESIENTENSDSSYVQGDTENSENPENSENTQSVESESEANSESSSTSVEASEPISEEPSSIPDSSYEVMETPVIPVPDKLVAADEDAFFNHSVFVGNSIMLGYQKFTNKQRAGSIENFLGNSKFFVAGSFGVYHNNRTPASKSGSSNPSYEGVKYSVEDAVGVMGVKTVYLNFMGLNDLSLYYDSENCARKCADDVIKMIGKINERYPDVKVVILSATYLTAARNNRPSLNNKNLSMLNNYLLDYCNENGLDFVDIASQLTEKGCLADKYASDGYCHIWTKGYMVWTAILRDYAVRKMNGTYQNPEKMPMLGINK